MCIRDSSTSTGADTTRLAHIETSTYKAPIEFGFHIQRRVYVRNNISFTVGLQDIVFENSAEGFNLDPKELSFFGVVSSQKEMGQYNMNTFIGFGTGGFGTIDTLTIEDLSQEEQDKAAEQPTGTNAGVFAGAIFNTPYLEKLGVLDIVGQININIINVFLRVPRT